MKLFNSWYKIQTVTEEIQVQLGDVDSCWKPMTYHMYLDCSIIYHADIQPPTKSRHKQWVYKILIKFDAKLKYGISKSKTEGPKMIKQDDSYGITRIMFGNIEKKKRPQLAPECGILQW